MISWASPILFALQFEIPDILLGIVAAQIANMIVMNMIEDMSIIPLDKVIPFQSFIISILISLAITIIASIFPIRHALSQNLHDSIDVQHVKTKLIVLSIERADKLNKPWSLLLSGVVLFSIGAGIYVLLPLSLVSSSITLLAVILFSLLTMIIVGLVILTINFEFLFERLISKVFLFWEQNTVRSISIKNLSAHRLRNRKATLQFSISLSFIVFVNIALKIIIQFVIDFNYHRNGGEIHGFISNQRQASLTESTLYKQNSVYVKNPQDIEKVIIANYSDIVKSITWASQPLEEAYPIPIRTQISNYGRSHIYNHQIIATTSKFMDDARSHNLQIGQMSEKRKLGKSGNSDYPIKQ
ncbi:MAG: putative DUF214 family protein, partial [Streblomastix strix]